MTEAHEVHLFSWIRENGPFLGPLLLLFVGAAIGWVKVMVSRYPTRNEIHRTIDDKLTACRASVDKRGDALENEQNKIIEAINALRIELSNQIREVDAGNRAAH